MWINVPGQREKCELAVNFQNLGNFLTIYCEAIELKCFDRSAMNIIHIIVSV